jgi:hypothetical protein
MKHRVSRETWEAEMLCKGVRRDWLVFAAACAALAPAFLATG